MTKQILVGGLPVGGGAPVSIQSMTNTPTQDVEATVAQIRRLVAAGCQIVRVAVPNLEAAKAVGKIKEQIDLPLVADIHFDYRLALECVAAGADKIRINPGNIGGADRVKAVAQACARRNIPIRIGVNGGSLEKPLLEKYGGVTPQAMVDSAFGHIALLNRYDFDDICVSLKASSVPITMGAYTPDAPAVGLPPPPGSHRGGHHSHGDAEGCRRHRRPAGPGDRGHSPGDPHRRPGGGGLCRPGHSQGHRPAPGGAEPHRLPHLRPGTKIDLIPLAQAVEERLKTVTKPITVAVMGCPVNGPGEAAAADVGIAGGNGKGLLFRHGKVVKQVPQEAMVEELMALIETL